MQFSAARAPESMVISGMLWQLRKYESRSAVAIMQQPRSYHRASDVLVESPRHGISSVNFLVGTVLWCLVLAALWFVLKKNQAEVARRREAPAASSSTGESETVKSNETATGSIRIGFPSRELPDFELPECMGGTVSRESLRGHRWVANFVFTRCAGPCPMMTRDMSELHRRVARTNPDFQFVTFTVDPDYDTPEVLKKYADTFLADHERWKFVTGNEEPLYDLIRQGFVQVVIPEVPEKRIPGFDIAHSNRAVLVNEDCIPVATFLMNVPEDVVKLRRIIEGKVEFPTPGPGLSVTPAEGENPSIQLTLTPVGGDAVVPPESAEPDRPVENPADKAPAESKSDESPQARNDRIDRTIPAWLARMPSVNAALNSVCTVLLITGFVAIRSGRRITHRNLMIMAFLVSVVFLGCYLTYHEALYRFTGLRGRAFIGSAPATQVYWSILIPHVILAATVPILALRVFWLAWRERWTDHRRLARITLPVWLFVSITGVVIYAMLYHWPWKMAAEEAVG